MILRYTKRCMILTIILAKITVLFWLCNIYTESSEKEFLTLPLVVVHLDFKGMPPQLSYLKSILPNLRRLGANGLLLEYEDFFPYEGKIKNLSSKYAYTKQELSGFLSFAHDLGFEIIPLVQTFGHLEFALKLPEFLHLREDPLYPDSICPTDQESQDLIEDMLRQVIEFHHKILPLHHMHIGCDEVNNLNVCDNCKIRNKSKMQIFIGHVNNVYAIMKSISPNVTVLIWDDMIRDIQHLDIKILNELLNVEPVHWDYKSDLSNPFLALYLYKHRFRNTWIATAFKGADGRTKTVPNLTTRYSNNYNWLKFMAGHKDVYKFKGIILTGWSRYGHMDPPCELLPASMPSLALNLLLVKRFQDGLTPKTFKKLSEEEFYEKYLHADFTKELSCNIISHNGLASIPECNPNFIQILLMYDVFQKQALKYYFEVGMHTVEYYYDNYNIVSPNSLGYEKWVLKTLQSLDQFTVLLSQQLKKYYDNNFIQEYLDIKSYHLKKLLNGVYSSFNSCKTVKVWSRKDDRNIFFLPER